MPSAGRCLVVCGLAPLLVLAPLLALGGCSKADDEPEPADMTIGEARALDRAAEMIEGQPQPASARVPEPAATE